MQFSCTFVLDSRSALLNETEQLFQLLSALSVQILIAIPSTFRLNNLVSQCTYVSHLFFPLLNTAVSFEFFFFFNIQLRPNPVCLPGFDRWSSWCHFSDLSISSLYDSLHSRFLRASTGKPLSLYISYTAAAASFSWNEN